MRDGIMHHRILAVDIREVPAMPVGQACKAFIDARHLGIEIVDLLTLCTVGLAGKIDRPARQPGFGKPARRSSALVRGPGGWGNSVTSQ
jgi:hypothetical protein